jgi:hypothetical protein
VPARACIPRPSPHSRAGQATVDYTALLAVVAVALAGAGTAVGVAEIPRAVVHAARTGLCIVGGDVCRTSDAAAAGLAPCLTDEQVDGRGLAVTILSVHLGRSGSWTVAGRSDGSVLVTRLQDDAVGLAGGIGVQLGPLAAAGASATFDLSLARGRAWELPSAAAAARLIAAVRRGDEPPVPPTWRFGDLGDELSASAGVTVPGAELTALEASGSLAEGVRTGRGETTVYVRVDGGASSPLVSLPASVRAGSAGPDGGGGALLLGVTRDAHGLRELSVRRATRGARAGEVVETVGRLDLRDPANRAAAAPLLSRRLPWPPAVAEDLRAVLRRTAQAGTVERAVYAVEDRSQEWAGALQLGLEVGLDLSELDVRRRLVDASAWTAGSPERRRADCLPELA